MGLLIGLACALSACAPAGPEPVVTAPGGTHRQTERTAPTVATSDPPHLSAPRGLSTLVLDQSERDALRHGADLAAAYLAKQCQTDGRFRYWQHLDPGVSLRPAYNVLRHAGTLYALAKHQAHWPKPETAAALGRCGRYLATEFVKPASTDAAGPTDGPPATAMALWSDGKTGIEAKLGGAGLGLVALAWTEKVLPGTLPNPSDGLGDFVLWMQRPDGGFYSKFLPKEGGRDDKWVSLYYPGEAALGLALLSERTGNDKWRSAAIAALSYLAHLREPQEAKDVEADHWALLATAEIWPSIQKDRALRELLLNHAKKIVEAMLHQRNRVLSLDDPGLKGAFVRDSRTTPTATRLEGLLAALTILAPGEPLTDEASEAVRQGLTWLRGTQVQEGPFAGAIPRALRLMSTEKKGGSRATKKFNRRAKEVRIDYVQHALSAFIQALDLAPAPAQAPVRDAIPAPTSAP